MANSCVHVCASSIGLASKKHRASIRGFLSSFKQQRLFTMIFVFAQPDLIRDYPVTAGVHMFQGKAAAACSSAILMTIGLPV